MGADTRVSTTPPWASYTPSGGFECEACGHWEVHYAFADSGVEDGIAFHRERFGHTRIYRYSQVWAVIR